jgi:hypothetical protein
MEMHQGSAGENVSFHRIALAIASCEFKKERGFEKKIE